MILSYNGTRGINCYQIYIYILYIYINGIPANQDNEREREKAYACAFHKIFTNLHMQKNRFVIILYRLKHILYDILPVRTFKEENKNTQQNLRLCRSNMTVRILKHMKMKEEKT